MGAMKHAHLAEEGDAYPRAFPFFDGGAKLDE